MRQQAVRKSRAFWGRIEVWAGLTPQSCGFVRSEQTKAL